jgi:hypothetical protein
MKPRARALVQDGWHDSRGTSHDEKEARLSVTRAKGPTIDTLT